MSDIEESVTAQVRSLYERFPFPAPYASDMPPAVDGLMSYTWVYYHTMHQYRPPQGRRIVDAGCGTGETLRRYALNNPGADLLGFDLSEASLRRAAAKVEAIPGVTVRLEHRDILRLEPPDRPYDLVSCTGVLHHLADPLKGLKNLAPWLAPDGIFSIYLYSAYARKEIEMAAQAIRMLCGPQEPLDRRLEVARRFFRALPPDHFLLDLSRFDFSVDGWIEKDEHLADMYLHPREVLYSLDQVLDLLDAAGLELVRFYDEAAWDLQRLLPDEELHRRTMFLTRRQKYQLADLLNPRPAYIFIARHQGAATARPPADAELPALWPVLSPVVTWVERRPAAPFPGIASETLLEVHGFTPQTYRMDATAVRLLERCDGSRTVDELAAEGAAAEGVAADEALPRYRALFATLHQRGIILMSPTRR